LTYSRVVVSGHAGIPLEAWLVRHDSPRGSVLLFHGYGDSKDSLLPMARAFYDLGFSLLIVDFYGSGGSGGSSTSVGYFEAEDVAAAFDATKHLPLGRPIVLHGVSMGGAAILRAADVHHLPADALILEAPFDCLLTTVRHRFDEMGAPAFPAADLLLFWGGVQQGFDARGFAPVEHARRVSIPTLLLVGARDPYVRRPEAEALAASLAGPRQLEIVPGLPHRRCILVDPARWRRVVAAFLDAQLES
jgi:alpha-beta hydrolase superfamily lysophospholipase